LMPDQMRADCMGCAGNALIHTPNLDALAAESVRFTRACTTSPLCMPARAAFISGTYCHNHGMWGNVARLPAHDETIFHHLQRAGYFTAHIGKSHYYQHVAGDHLRDWQPYMHARGFDYVHETTGPWATAGTDSYMTDHWAREGLLAAFRDDYERRRGNPAATWPSPLPVDEHPDSYVGREACRLLERCPDDRPLCMFVGFPGPHEPWDAPGEYAEMYDPDAMPSPIPASTVPEWLSEHALHYAMRGRHEDLSDDDFARLGANYYGKISLIDHWIGRILDAQRARGRMDDTVIILWSDHGEMLGDHLRLHKTIFFESALRVPMMVRWPGLTRSGATCAEPVQQIDIFRTLLEGLELEPSQRALGRSLIPLLRGEEDPREAISEVDHYTCLCTERYKYVMHDSGAGLQLFDLEEDPGEQENLCGREDARDLEIEMRDRMLNFIANTQVRMPWGPGAPLQQDPKRPLPWLHDEY
ncbi:MAG: sulfatase-like hydrolase/transferase, partial [Armatimonadetes bacterium]|nr:sulfatase-like hydrolase/transferase [Armatimonadota bacterium]